MKWSPFYRSHSQEGGREYTLPEQGEQYNNARVYMCIHATCMQSNFVWWPYEVFLYVIHHSSVVRRIRRACCLLVYCQEWCIYSYWSSCRLWCHVVYTVTWWGSFLPNFWDWGLVHISRPQPCAKREPEIALFPAPTQLSVTCRIKKRESLVSSLTWVMPG